MQYRGHSKPLPVPKQDPPFAAVRSAGPNNFTMRTFDANTGDAGFHGRDGWEYEGRRERVPVPVTVCCADWDVFPVLGVNFRIVFPLEFSKGKS
jgi:hypothetical protein